jgi:hypothetical protein
MSEKIQKKEIERVKEISKLIDWRVVEEKAEGEERFFVEGEGLHLIKNLLRGDEGTIMGFYGYLEKMVETLIGEILRGEGKEMIKKDTGEKGKGEARALFEKVFKKKHEELNVKMGGGWDYICPEAFWVLVEEGFEWKWKKIIGWPRWGFLRRKTEEAKKKTWTRIEVFLKPEIPARLFLRQDKDEEMVRQKMIEAGMEKELVEKILDARVGKEAVAIELTRKGVPGEIIDRLIIREEYLESLKKLYRVKRGS